MSLSRRKLWGHALSVLTLLLAFLMFFPILWMALTSFKTEAAAIQFPPPIFFEPTLANWQNALFNSPFMEYLGNTVIITTLVDSLSAATRYSCGVRDGVLPDQAHRRLALVDDVHPDAAARWYHRALVRPLLAVQSARHALRDDPPLRRDESAARRVDAALVYVGSSLRSHRSGAARRRKLVAGIHACHHAAACPRSRCNGAALRDFHLERVLLSGEPNLSRRLTSLSLRLDL